MVYKFSADRNIEIVLTNKNEKNFSLHVHSEHFVFSIVTEGFANLLLNNIETVCNPGDVFVVRPFIPHALKVSNDTTVVSVSINKFFLTDKNLSKENILSEISDLLEEKIIDSENKKILMEEIENFLKSPIADKNISEDMKKLSETMIKNAKECKADSLSLDTLSEEVCKTKFYLIKKFRTNIGLTPHQFEILIRIRNAQKDIRNGKRLIDAAIDNGFYDSSHFTKTFEKITGTSPSEYENLVKKE